MNNKTFANREVLNLIFCDYNTQAPFMNCNYANSSSNAITGESMYAYGGQGHPKRVTFYGEKGGTFTVVTQLMTAQLFSLMSGATIENTAKFVTRVVKTATDGVITLDADDDVVPGSVNVFAANDDCGTLVPVTVADGKITLTDLSSSNDEYIVYYVKNLTSGVQRLNIKSTTFPKAVTIYGDTYMKSEDDEIIPYKLVVYKASPQSNFEMSFASSGDPVSITVTFDMLVDENDNMMDMILIGE